MSPTLDTPRSTDQKHSRRVVLLRARPPLAIAAFVILLLYPLTLLGQALYWGDLFLYFYPMEQLVRDSLLSGRIPLWNPYVFCGQPLVGNPQSWVFYPSTALLALLPVWLYFTVSAAMHLLLAGWGTYLYLRRIAGDRTAAALGGVVYAGSGFLLARLQFPTMIQTAAYLPWLLLLVDRLVDRPQVGYAALMAAVVALSLMAAHAQVAYMAFGCAALYAVARLWQARRNRARMKNAFLWMVGGLAVGVVAASVQLLPTLQLFAESTRTRLTWDEANRFVLHPQELLNFVTPRFFGDPARGDYWGQGNMWEPCVYVGLLPLILAGYAVARGSRRLAVRFYALLAAISVLLALGKFGGVYWIAYLFVPGIQSFHDPARFTFLATFGLAVLAALGLRSARDAGLTARARTVIAVVAAADLLWFSSGINPTLRASAFGYRPRVLAYVPRPGEGRVATRLREEVWSRFVNYADYGPDSARYAHELADTLSPDVGMRFQVEEASGYEPVPVRAMFELDELLKDTLSRQSGALPKLLSLQNAHTLLLPQATRYPQPGFRRLPTRGVTALQLADPMPRAWLVRRTVRVDGSQRSLSAVAEEDFDPRLMAVVSDGSGLLETNLNALDRTPTQPVQRRFSPGSEAFDVDVGDRAAYLVVSATCYPGWRATIDGRRARLVRTNHAFLGMVVPPGRHTVRLTYSPAAFRVGLYLSLVAAAATIAGLTVGLVARLWPAYGGIRFGPPK